MQGLLFRLVYGTLQLNLSLRGGGSPGKLVGKEAAMLGTDDGSITRRWAVVQRAREYAAKQALLQGRLNATVIMIDALAAADSAGPDDYRRFFMAWQATRVLRPRAYCPPGLAGAARSPKCVVARQYLN